MTTLTVANLAERVEAGAALLDANEPGWAERIDLERLDLVNVWGCVLGQVFGSYMEGTAALGIDRWGEESASYGFRLSDADEFEDDSERPSWEALTEAWRDLLLSREDVPVSVEVAVEVPEVLA